MMVKLQVRPVRACKTHFDLQDQRRIAPVGPSLLNILQAGTGVASLLSPALYNLLAPGELANQENRED